LHNAHAAAKEAAKQQGSVAMSLDAVDFASLLCSRLCHDLLSPVGAMANGLELLADETDPAMRDQCMDLLAISASTTANKLKFFRLAFGAAGGYADNVDTRDAQEALSGLFQSNGRVKLGWMVDAPVLPKPAVKLLLNMAMIAGDAMVRGGDLVVGAEARDGAIEIVIRAEGPRLILDPEIRAAMLGEVAETSISPRTAGAWLAHEIASRNGGSIRASDPADPILLLGATLNTA